MWMQDRFEDGRRTAERSIRDGRKAAERSFEDGRRVVGRTFDDGRREAERRFEEGRHLVADRFDDGRRAVRDGRRAIRSQFGERAPAVEAGVVAGAVLWPTLMLMAGAGVAYWMWSQYARSRPELGSRRLDEPGGAGPTIAKPELVMAHNTTPATRDPEVADPSATDLVEPAAKLMMHAPLDDDAPAEASKSQAMKAAPRAAILKRRTAKAPKEGAAALASAASAAQAATSPALESNLAVQGAAGPPLPSKNGASAPGPSAKPRKGPTVM